MKKACPLRGLFVTGTDTGVGKTTVGMALLRWAQRRGFRPVPFKPVETGCSPAPVDAEALWRAALPSVAVADTCLYPLRLPAAPSEAAAAEGVRISLDRIAERAQALSADADFLLVEGAGGLLVPYGDGVTTVELAARLGLPLLVVARTALGTINHTALTLREAARQNLTVAGLILNRTEAEIAPHEPSNAKWIAALTGREVLGTLPYLPGARRSHPDALADALAAAVGAEGLDRLWAARGLSAERSLPPGGLSH